MNLGITSTVLTNKTIEEIISLATKNHLTAVEWSEKLLPIGDFSKADHIALLAGNAGLIPLAYNVSFNPLLQEEKVFDTILKTARRLGTHIITLQYDFKDTEESLFVEKIRHLAQKACKAHFTLCLPCHFLPNCSGYADALRILSALSPEAIVLCWEPKHTASMIYNIFELKMLASHIRYAYIGFSGEVEETESIIVGQDEWQQYIKVLSGGNTKSLLFHHYDEKDFSSDCRLMADWLKQA